MLQFKTLMGVVFKPHRLLGDDFHPGQAGRQDPTEKPMALLAGLALSASVRLATAGANASIFAIYGGSSTAALAAAGINTQLGGVAGNAKVGYNFSAIEAAHKQDGVTTFLDVDFIWKGRSYLNVGWEASLTDLVSAAVPHLRSGAVTGLFLGDVRAARAREPGPLVADPLRAAGAL